MGFHLSKPLFTFDSLINVNLRKSFAYFIADSNKSPIFATSNYESNVPPTP